MGIYKKLKRFTCTSIVINRLYSKLPKQSASSLVTKYFLLVLSPSRTQSKRLQNHIDIMSTTMEEAPPPAYTISKNSSTTSYPTNEKFASTYLTINAQGKHWNDFSTRGKQLEIPIFDASNHRKYSNIRPDPKSSSCILYLEENNSSHRKKVSETTYKWGPGRHPVIKFYSSTSPSENKTEDFTVSSKFLSRTTVFPSARFGKFTWVYASRNPNGSITGKGAGDICLVQHADAQGREVEEREVARLVRNKETRPEATNWSEGTGGRLELSPRVVEGGTDMEVFVITTLLLMLKKELDDLLNNQVALVT